MKQTQKVAGRTLGEILVQSGVPFLTIAERLNVRERSVQRWATGYNSPHLREMVALVRLLNEQPRTIVLAALKTYLLVRVQGVTEKIPDRRRTRFNKGKLNGRDKDRTKAA